MKKRIRIKDIAKKAGVSTGTVDRVLHKRGNVSKRAEEAVLQVMRDLNYEPNIIASTLALNRIFRIATLLPDYRQDIYWEQPRQGVEKAFNVVQHYNLEWEPEYFDLDDTNDFRQKARKIMENPPSALMLAPVFLPEALELIEMCREKMVPVVKINTDIEENHSLCYVGQDSYQSGVLAGKLFNFFLHDDEMTMVLNLDRVTASAQHLIDKEQGIRDFFSDKFGSRTKVVKYEFADFDEPARLRAFLEDKLRAFPKLKGIFVTNSRSYKILDSFGKDFPKDLRIVGFDLLEPNLKYLRENRITFLINQNPVQQGYQGIINLANYLVLKKEVDPVQYLPLDIVVTENVQYYLNRQQEFQLVV